MVTQNFSEVAIYKKTLHKDTSQLLVTLLGSELCLSLPKKKQWDSIKAITFSREGNENIFSLHKERIALCCSARAAL